VIPALPLFAVLGPIERPLRWGLEHLHSQVGLTWAWSIIALTIIVRLALVPLTVRQIHSMQRMQAFMPQMKEIQKKYKGDRQKSNEELMKFYREHNINPAASCLPMLVQIPIFFALYFVLKDFEKTTLKNDPDANLSWLHIVPNITDGVTAHWSGYLLVVIYTASQISSTYFMSTTMDKTQRILFMILPLGFVFFLLSGSAFFPVGLLLYWVTTNLWTVGQGLVTRRLVPRTAALEPPKRSSRTPPGGGKPKGEGGGGNGGSPPEPNEAPPAPAAPRRVKRKKRARR
jgi:YidC/Oxa1 family membrane protein insertase